MPALTWDNVGERFYETGVDRGVLYLAGTGAAAGTYPLGVPWNGLVSVTESPSGAEPTPMYADNIKYLNLLSLEEFMASIEAYTYPAEFAACDGSASPRVGMSLSQQGRRGFGLAYRTRLGNDTNGPDHGFKLNLIYGALAAPSEKANTTINDTPEAVTFSWDLSTTPVPVAGYRPTSKVTIDSTKVAPAGLTALENVLFGSATLTARLPLPAEVMTLIGAV